MESSEQMVIAADDAANPDFVAVVKRHLGFAYETTPPEDVFALGAEALQANDITVFSARIGGVIVGIGALREMTPGPDGALEGEVKSMHTTAEARGRGVGEAMVRHVVAVATSRGYERLSLETGSMDAFAPARALYAKVGFVECGPFGGYRASPNSTFMTTALS